MKINLKPTDYIGILDNRYYLIKQIDDGATCYLYKVLDINTGEIKAAKIFKKGRDYEYKQELDSLKSISDSNYVIKYLSSGEGLLVIGEAIKRKYIILEYAKGSLFKYRLSTNNISEDTCKYIFYYIILAIKSLHEKGICHRDIKLENILFVGDEYSIKLCDFGFSASFFDKYNNKIKLKDGFGSEFHYASEILLKQSYDGEKIDIFTAGVTLLSLVLGKYGFFEASVDDRYYDLIIKKKYDEYWNIILWDKKISDDLKKLYIKMVEYIPENRISIDEILKCEWLSDIRNANEEKLKELKLKMINELKGAKIQE